MKSGANLSEDRNEDSFVFFTVFKHHSDLRETDSSGMRNDIFLKGHDFQFLAILLKPARAKENDFDGSDLDRKGFGFPRSVVLPSISTHFFGFKKKSTRSEILHGTGGNAD